MKMIWPGRALGVALLVPALLSLALVRQRVDLAARAGARRGGRRWWRSSTWSTLGGRGPVAGRAARGRGLLARRAAGGRADRSKTRAGAARSLRLRDDVPDEFAAEPAAFEVDVPGRRQAVLAYRFVPKRRGTYVFEQVDALVASRLGFWRRQCSWPLRTEVRVYPDIHQIARYTMLARRDRLSTMGVRRSRRLGTDNEFERLRDYIEGDDPRHIDWRATARRRKLTCRAFQLNQSQRIIFLIDCGRMMAGDTGDGLSPLDHAFNAMLLLAHVALIRGDQVGLARLLGPGPGLRPARRRPAADQPAGAQRPQRLSRAGRASLRPGLHRAGAALPQAVAGRPDDQPVRRAVNAQLAGDYLRNLTGRHLPLGVFLRDHDLFALADTAPADGPGLFAGAAAAVAAELARARAGRPAAARGLDPRRLPRGTDGRAGQSLPRDQGPAPALTRTVRSSNRRLEIDRWTRIQPPDDPDLDNPYAPPAVRRSCPSRSPELIRRHPVHRRRRVQLELVDLQGANGALHVVVLGRMRHQLGDRRRPVQTAAERLGMAVVRDPRLVALQFRDRALAAFVARSGSGSA